MASVVVEHLLGRAAEALRLHRRMSHEWGQGFCEGQARAFYEAAHAASENKAGWATFEEWRQEQEAKAANRSAA